MKPLEKTELYNNLSGFLKTKGIELKAGSYANAIEKSCHLLADAINLGQKGVGRAKVEVEAKLDQMRQVIHEKTAPKPPVLTPKPPSRPASKKTTGDKATAGQPRPRKRAKKQKSRS
jgi:hypothetical protein